tara:strand:+ start:10258 stop:11199 length:942 start_codon:yes stop_codon:yes gene_type:complete
MKKHTPWVEKYRPSKFDDIVLGNVNKTILSNIVEIGKFPNMIFYGPPGTGKTTTIINLIKMYQEKYNEGYKNLVIHLNASDDRGIDVIRNQIQTFVTTKTLFSTGTKFVVLDEVDYMTKNAQSALRTLVQSSPPGIVFCLICNYISRIYTSLQNEFMQLRFSQLPKREIIKFINNIKTHENLVITNEEIEDIQNLYKSDIRSIINHMQSSCINNITTLNTLTIDTWDKLITVIKRGNTRKTINHAHSISISHNICIKKLAYQFISYLIYNKPYTNAPKWMNLFKYIIYNSDNCESQYIINYFFSELCDLYKLV